MFEHARRDAVISAAIAAGKFSEDRRSFWETHYDRDPAGTEATLAMLAPVLPVEPYPRELFPELRRQPQPVAASALHGAATAYPTAQVTPEVVAVWSRDLFPETQQSSQQGRVTRAND